MNERWKMQHPAPVFSSGFTLIEIMVVVVVIGILASIMLAVDGTLMPKARDNERLADVTGLAKEFEQFYRSQVYDFGASYPRRSGYIYNESRIKIPGSLDFYTYADPSLTEAPRQTNNSVIAAQNETVPQSPTINQYIYQPFGIDDKICTNNNSPCVRFKFYFRREVDNQVVTIDSMRQQ